MPNNEGTATGAKGCGSSLKVPKQNGNTEKAAANVSVSSGSLKKGMGVLTDRKGRQ